MKGNYKFYIWRNTSKSKEKRASRDVNELKK
jgi:hypothetical protein